MPIIFPSDIPYTPHTEVTEKGDIVYMEIMQESVRKLEGHTGDGPLRHNFWLYQHSEGPGRRT